MHSDAYNRVAMHELSWLSGLALKLRSVQLVYNTLTGKEIPPSPYIIQTKIVQELIFSESNYAGNKEIFSNVSGSS